MPEEVRETILDSLYSRKLHLKDHIEKLADSNDQSIIEHVSKTRSEVTKIESSIRWIHEQRV